MIESRNDRDPVPLSSPPLRIRSSVVVLLLGVIVFGLAWIERLAISRSIYRLWVVSDHLEPADAVAILGGRVETRPYAAAQLYTRGLVRKILVSSGGFDANRDRLVELGIPPEAITEFGSNPSNTYKEATALAHWAELNRAQRIIVPTEIFQSRRVAWILRRELSTVGAHLIIETLAPPSYDIDNWWQRKAGLIEFQKEAIKYLYYRIRY
jgi:uncharacterized SAM-binding protein YcdF (DUF218 family)